MQMVGLSALCRKHKKMIYENWMICVNLFEEYGTSPQSGWIEEKHKEDFYRFVDDITETYRDYVERQKEQ